MVIDNLLRALVPSIGGYTPVGASAALVADPADYVLAAAAGGSSSSSATSPRSFSRVRCWSRAVM